MPRHVASTQTQAFRRPAIPQNSLRCGDTSVGSRFNESEHHAMKCPHDGTELGRVTAAGIELDKCHKCDGIWFDHGEMERLRDSDLTDVEQMLEQQYGDPAYKEGETSGFMRCPRCEDARLQGCHYTFMKPVRIDRCESCFGVWLDKGELEAIIGERRELENPSEAGSLRSFVRSLAKTLGR
jgi:Zn-finger nucleic acid-binding protein